MKCATCEPVKKAKKRKRKIRAGCGSVDDYARHLNLLRGEVQVYHF